MEKAIAAGDCAAIVAIAAIETAARGGAKARAVVKRHTMTARGSTGWPSSIPAPLCVSVSAAAMARDETIIDRQRQGGGQSRREHQPRQAKRWPTRGGASVEPWQAAEEGVEHREALAEPVPRGVTDDDGDHDAADARVDVAE